MYTTTYKERRTYERYDDNHFLLYLGEQEAEYTPSAGGHIDDGAQAAPAPVSGYSYTGDQPDGGTLIAAKEATYPAFVSGLIGQKYMDDDVQAIQSNMVFALANKSHEKAAQYKQEFNDYQAYRTECKAIAKVALGIE
jgi:hypothetical protein